MLAARKFFIDGNLVEKVEKGFAILGLLFFTGSFTRLFPEAVLSLLRYGIWLTSSFLIFYRWRKTLYIASRDIFLWLVTALALLSFSWSDAPKLTFSNSREIMQMTSFGLYLASTFTLKEQLKLLAWTLGIGTVASAIAAIGVPSFGTDLAGVHAGSWKGIYGHKNTFGSIMTLSLVVFFLLPVNNQRERIFKWFGFGLSVCLVLLSTSKTSLVLSISILLILFLYSKFRWRGKLTVLLLDLAVLIVGGAATLVLSNWEAILTGMGKDPTLTGRTQMWGVIFEKLGERIWLGFGRGGFWAPGSQYALEAGLAVSRNFVPPHAHNGFIDLALDIGLIGFLCFSISFLIAYFKALKCAYLTKAPYDYWPLAFLSFLVINNLSESLLLYLSNIYWVLYITVALSMQPNRSSSIHNKL